LNHSGCLWENSTALGIGVDIYGYAEKYFQLLIGGEDDEGNCVEVILNVHIYIYQNNTSRTRNMDFHAKTSGLLHRFYSKVGLHPAAGLKVSITVIILPWRAAASWDGDPSREDASFGVCRIYQDITLASEIIHDIKSYRTVIYLEFVASLSQKL